MRNCILLLVLLNLCACASKPEDVYLFSRLSVEQLEEVSAVLDRTDIEYSKGADTIWVKEKDYAFAMNAVMNRHR